MEGGVKHSECRFELALSAAQRGSGRWPITDCMLTGIELSGPTYENGFVSWCEAACDEVAAGMLSYYFRKELGVCL